MRSSLFVVLPALLGVACLLAFAESKQRAGVEICRVVCDPPGKEPDDEVIEVCNRGFAPVDLSGWRLSDGEGEYEFPSQTTLKPGERLALTGLTLNPTRKTKGIWLANEKDCVQLIDGEGKVVSEKCWRN